MGKLINKALHGCTSLLRLFHHADHTADGIVGRQLGNGDGQSRFTVDAARIDRVAHCLLHRHTFARNRRLIHR